MPATPQAGGQRRLDRVLDPAFVADLAALDLDALRERRSDADQEEVDLSYVRRLLQGRIDLVEAERSRRGRPEGAAAGEEGDEALVQRLAAALADEDRAPAQGLGRHRLLDPTRVGETRREEESAAADPRLDDPASLSDDELDDALARLREEERGVSALRRRVQDVMDALSGEVTRRYRDGSASVDALLPG